MPWPLITKAFGWLAATDEDGDTPILVVWHPRLRRHFTGSDAWRRAVRASIYAPQPDPADADGQGGSVMNADLVAVNLLAQAHHNPASDRPAIADAIPASSLAVSLPGRYMPDAAFPLWSTGTV